MTLDNLLASPRVISATEQPVLKLLRSPLPTEYKKSFGHVAVLEGEPQKQGASRLSARAALRAGAGLVTLLVHDVSGRCTYDLAEFMKQVFTLQANDSSLEPFSALVIGPGLGLSRLSQTRGLLAFDEALKQNRPVVLDADGLSFLKNPDALTSNTQSVVIATPHPGEAGKILGTSTLEVEENRLKALHDLCTLSHPLPFRVIWVLKGSSPLVCETGKQPVLCEGNVPLLGVGGSGDVLSGCIAALIPRTDDPFDAALLGVTALLAAGRKLERQSKRGLLASEIADGLSAVLYPPSSF